MVLITRLRSLWVCPRGSVLLHAALWGRIATLQSRHGIKQSGALTDVHTRRQGELQHVILLSLSVSIAILRCVGGAGVTAGMEKMGECDRKSHRGLSESQEHRD